MRQGIFATHLHKLLELPLATQHQVRMCMETRELGDGRYVEPTLRLVPGQCTNSLALTVARAAGIPQGLLDRAEYMHQVTTPPTPPDPSLAKACGHRRSLWAPLHPRLLRLAVANISQFVFVQLQRPLRHPARLPERKAGAGQHVQLLLLPSRPLSWRPAQTLMCGWTQLLHAKKLGSPSQSGSSNGSGTAVARAEAAGSTAGAKAQGAGTATASSGSFSDGCSASGTELDASSGGDPPALGRATPAIRSMVFADGSLPTHRCASSISAPRFRSPLLTHARPAVRVSSAEMAAGGDTWQQRCVPCRHPEEDPVPPQKRLQDGIAIASTAAAAALQEIMTPERKVPKLRWKVRATGLSCKDREVEYAQISAAGRHASAAVVGGAGGGTRQAAAPQHRGQVVPVPVHAPGRVGILRPVRPSAGWAAPHPPVRLLTSFQRGFSAASNRLGF